ncbi:aldehyde dehydrogenase family protein [Micromonospora sp. NPDC048830]|uniref:aldehyde dehydrogenase family protein n=1 Tax=Micromonospora sp. NPDC048830 TaxID=3364257 RepID=UPI00371A1DDF
MPGRVLPGPDQRGLFIAGGWREAEEGATFPVRDPADGSVLASDADGSVKDAVEALDAAVAARKDWAASAPRDRGEILRVALNQARWS